MGGKVENNDSRFPYKAFLCVVNGASEAMTSSASCPPLIPIVALYFGLTVVDAETTELLPRQVLHISCVMLSSIPSSSSGVCILLPYDFVYRCLTLASMCLLTWSSALAEVLALVVGFNAMQALKCCCCPDRCDFASDRSICACLYEGANEIYQCRGQLVTICYGARHV